MRRRIAMISEHASPLGVLGGIDGGGQNVYVAQLARRLAKLGHEVDVFTRRDDPELPPIVNQGDGLRVVHIEAGPAHFVPKESMLPWMADFAREMVKFIVTTMGLKPSPSGETLRNC
jgi:D-inositol-3-phosphate glycosyltransferase